jgi:hypothetical protein
MFPGFWYAGKPIGLAIGPMLAVIWKFFLASVVAGCATSLIVRSMPYFATMFGTRGALVRGVLVSLVFFALYLSGVIALHKGLKPLNETASLLRDSLPEGLFKGRSPAAVEAELSEIISGWLPGGNLQADSAAVPDDIGAKV